MRNNLLLLIFLSLIGKLYSQTISLDPSFGNDGYASFSIQNINRLTNTIALPNGDLITGYARTTSSSDFIHLRRTDENGLVDDSFYGSFSLPGVIRFKKLVLDNDKIIVLGTYAASSPYNMNDILVIQFNMNGDVDTNFGNNGYKLLAYDDSSSDEAIDFMVDDSGNRYIYASYGANTNSSAPNYYVIKTDSTGEVDNSFGSNGRLFLYYYNQYDADSDKFLPKIFLQNDGKFLLAGRKKNSSSGNWESYIERKLQDGTYDASFGDNGELVFSDSEYSFVKNLEYNYNDNSILVLHEYKNTSYSMDRIFLSKIQLANGDLISSFGDNGTSDQYMFQNAPQLVLEHIKTLSDSKILVVGSVSNMAASPSINTKLLVMRFNSDGTLDYTSSSSGYHIFEPTPPNSSMRADHVTNLFELSGGSFIIGYSGSSAVSGAFSYLTKFNGATLGIEQNTYPISHTIYPNPTHNHITVTRKDAVHDQFHFSIVDLSGKVVKRGKSKLGEKIWIENLSKGSYVFYVEIEGGISTSEIIIKK